MPGFTPDATPHVVSGTPQPRVSTRVRKAVVPKVKGHVKSTATYGVPKASKPRRAKGPAIPKAPAGITDRALIDAATRLRFGGQEQGIQQQLDLNQRYSNGLPAWFQQAQAQIRGLQQQGQANSQQVLGQVQSYASQPTLPGNPTDVQAATARNNLNAQFANMFGRDAAANSAFMDRLAAAQGIAQGNAQNAANAQRQGLLGEQGQLKGTEGDYRTTYGANLQAGQTKAANDALKLQLAAKAFGIKVDTLNKVQIPLAQSLQHNRTAGQKVARSGVRIKKQSQAETKHQNAVSNALKVNDLALKAYKLAHPNAGKGGGSNTTYSKSKVQGFRANWDYAQATAHQLREKKTYTDKAGKVQPVTSDVAYSALLSATKDPDIAKAAALAAYGKPIPADLRHRLAIKGVHPPKVKKPKSILGEVVGALTGG